MMRTTMRSLLIVTLCSVGLTLPSTHKTAQLGKRGAPFVDYATTKARGGTPQSLLASDLLISFSQSRRMGTFGTVDYSFYFRECESITGDC
jgi:hypothetical protein